MHAHVDYAEMCLNIFLQAESACRFLLALIQFQWVHNQSDVLKPGFPRRISHVPLCEFKPFITVCLLNNCYNKLMDEA